jgi:hypothetical protein
MSELDALRVRDEVLQAMYWLRAEGIDPAPTADVLARFLAVPAATLGPYLERFTNEGYLERSDGGHVLTAEGEEAGKRTFADEFAGLTGASHGECDENCWCHDSPEAAADCLHERSAHVH